MPVSEAATIVSRIISADELDVTVAKHPASLVARFMLIQQALEQVRLQYVLRNFFVGVKFSNFCVFYFYCVVYFVFRSPCLKLLSVPMQMPV
jgi:hypothetical protein